MDFFLRKADVSDMHDIWLWRNDPVTREMSINTGLVEWDKHQEWFKGFLLNSDRHMYIAVSGAGKRIGMCRFDVSQSHHAEVSINLSPEFRGQGLSRPFLSQATDRFTNGEMFLLNAKIKHENIASYKCFAGAGYDVIEEGESHKILSKKCNSGVRL